MTQADIDPLIGFTPRLRKSPFFAATRRYGCKAYTVYNHMCMPLSYEDPVAEFWRLVNDVTLWDVACERQVEITGPDAARFVQHLTPRNLSNCVVGQGKYVLITAEDGGINNDPVLLRLGENHFWLSLADSDVLLWARGVAVNAGMNVTIIEPDVSPIQVQGPKSVQVMQALFGDWLLDLPYFRFRETDLDGIPVVVSRTGWSSERGYEIFLRDGGYGDDLWEAVMEAGKPYNIAPIAPSQIRRVEGGMMSYGTDMTRDENPYELGFDRLVDLKQEAQFIGKAALKRIKVEGVKRRFVGMEIHGDPLAASNEHYWPVSREGRRVGKVTSCVYSPRLQRNIGMALVAVEHAELGAELTVGTPSSEAEATVAPIPFVDPNKEIPRGQA
ncbi:MAG: glycine cleavage T C-terminal barrel domain-containing protein [Alphaproteobacteria bacterium]